MRRHDVLRLLSLAGIAAGTFLLAGCDEPGLGSGLGAHRHRRQAATEETGGPIEAKQPLAAVLDRVNRNSAGMDFMLRAGGVNAKGEYVEHRKREPYELKGTLLYRRPSELYLELKHSLGGKMEIGSNANEFWVWKRLGHDRYWWGEQKSVEAHQELDIPLRPTDIVEVLGLGELPTGTIQARDFTVTDSRYEIRIPGRDAKGKTYTAKIIRVDRRAPYLVREMEYFYPGGRQRVVAYLSRYGRIDGSTVLAPHRIQITWPERGGNMDLQFSTMERFDSSEAAKRFLSPVQRGRHVGPMERVDEPTEPRQGVR